MERHGTEPSMVPERVSREKFKEAIAPLMDLLGTHYNRVFADPGIHIEGGIITLTVAGHVVTSASARPVVVGAEREFQEAATEVRIVVYG